MKTCHIHAIKPYDITIKSNHLKQLDLSATRDYVIITDDGVPKQWLDCVLKNHHDIPVLTVKRGENSKTLSVYGHLIHELQLRSIDRTACLIALGGGVVGDLTGFIASTYLRGIDWHYIPTTLLAMVDASIGGKVALNTDLSKNAIGCFYPPIHVSIDPNVLSTLPEKEMQNGYAEIIKIAAIKDAVFFNQLTSQSHPIEDIIFHAITLKKWYIEQDPYDQNIRKHLNFGHTIGHALEHMHDYTYSHGQAIAYGMRIMTHQTACENPLIDLLTLYGLDTVIPYDKEQLIQRLLRDKKKQQHTIDFIVLKAIGEAEIDSVPLSKIGDYIQKRGVI